MKHFFEVLEPRIAPATLIDGGKGVQFQDVDGDLVTLRVSKGTLAEGMFTFDVDNWDGVDVAQVLQSLDLRDSQFKGASITVSVEAAGGGDGLVDIGKLFAGTNNLGTVEVKGGLVAIESGAVKTLTVDTLGIANPNDFGLLDRISQIQGKLNSLVVNGDFGGALKVIGGKKGQIGRVFIGGSMLADDVTGTTGWIQSEGKIGQVTIEGGIDASGSSADKAGSILSQNNIGKVFITGDILGGSGDHSGSLVAGGNMTSFTLTGNLVGGEGDYSGRVSVAGKLGAVSIIGDIQGGGAVSAETTTKTSTDSQGNLVETTTESVVTSGNYGGSIYAAKGIKSILLEGSLIGGIGTESGSIKTEGSLGAVTVKNGIVGGGTVERVTITEVTMESPEDEESEEPPVVLRTVVEEKAVATGSYSGSIYAAGNIKSITVGEGGIQGGEGANSASIQSDGSLGTLSVKGSIIGGGSVQVTETVTNYDDNDGNPVEIIEQNAETTGNSSATVYTVKRIKNVIIEGNLTGGHGTSSASIDTDNAIGKISIAGDLVGGGSITILTKTTNSFEIPDTDDEDSEPVAVQLVEERGFISGNYGALIYGGTGIKNIVVEGSMLGGHGTSASSIQTDGKLGTVWIGGIIQGGGATEVTQKIKIVDGGDPEILSESLVRSGRYAGLILGQEGIAKLTVNPNFTGPGLIGGAGDSSALIQSYATVGSIYIGGGIQGGDGQLSGVVQIGGNANQITIDGGIEGGSGWVSGNIEVYGDLKQLAVEGDISGGTNDYSGRVWVDGSLSKAAIQGDIQGGNGTWSGVLVVNGSSNEIQLNGSLIGTSSSFSGVILVNEFLSKVNIQGDIIGGNNLPVEEGEEEPPQTSYTGALIAGEMGSVFIAGNIQSGTLEHEGGILTNSGVVRSFWKIKDITVGGSLIGNEDVPVLITGGWEVKKGLVYYNNNVVIGSVFVSGDVSHSLILAGVGVSDDPDNLAPGVNPFARINSVTVEGNWTASSIAAGVNPGPNGYGDGDTLIPKPAGWTVPDNIYSRIAKIVIGGTVSGGAEGQQYGFASGDFGSITIGGQKVTIPSPGQTVDITPDGGVKVHTVNETPPDEGD